MRKSIAVVLVVWIVSLVIATVVSEAVMGSLSPTQPEWAKSLATFLETTGLIVVAIPTMFITGILYLAWAIRSDWVGFFTHLSTILRETGRRQTEAEEKMNGLRVIS